jgi:methionyl aminopeptidase
MLYVNKQKYIEAGDIHSDAISEAENLLKPGLSHLNLVNADLAFPIGISVNHEAAHRTPAEGGERNFTNKDVVCIDIGVHVDGFVVDGAVTVDISGEYKELINSVDKSLAKALSVVEEGTTVREIGHVIGKNISSKGFCPINNLHGHRMSQYEIHEKPRIPNTKRQGSSAILTEGDVVAIEPFASINNNMVATDKSNTQIYSLNRTKEVQTERERKVKRIIEQDYSQFPFALRWLPDDVHDSTIQGLVNKNILASHPPLRVPGTDVVAQAEHTIIVEECGYTKLT